MISNFGNVVMQKKKKIAMKLEVALACDNKKFTEILGWHYIKILLVYTPPCTISIPIKAMCSFNILKFKTAKGCIM